MSASGTASLDFGAFPGATDATVAVTGQAAIVADSLVGAWIRPVATAEAYRDVILADSPVAYFRMGEGSGNIVDEVAAKTGAASGSPAGYGVAGALAGDANTAINFDAGWPWFTVTDHADFDLGDGPWSVEMWIKRNSVGGNFQQALAKGTQGNFDFRSDNKFGYDSGGNRIAVESGSTTDLSWHHFVVTRTGTGTGNTKVYKDGADVTTETDVSLTTASNATNLFIGVYTSTNSPLLGQMDELAIYGAVLSAGQVLAHYQAGQAQVGHSADEHRVEDLLVVADTIEAGVGFTIFGRAGNNRLYGAWSIAWAWS